MKKLIIGIIAVIIIAALVYLAYAGAFTGKAADGAGGNDALAKCLTEKGAKMYGAFWCPHCNNQEKMFGESWRYVTYIECSTPDGRGQTQACIDARIQGYPTWVFSDGERVEGEMSFEQLAQKAGCQ